MVLVSGLLILTAVLVWQLRRVSTARDPSIRTTEALAITLPLFLLLSATVYFTMATANPGNFSTNPLTRTDTLYFTVTVFSTVGFGDITAATQSARLVVTAQMLGGRELNADLQPLSAITDGTVRLSIGLEDVADIKADIDQALKASQT